MYTNTTSIFLTHNAIIGSGFEDLLWPGIPRVRCIVRVGKRCPFILLFLDVAHTMCLGKYMSGPLLYLILCEYTGMFDSPEKADKSG